VKREKTYADKLRELKRIEEKIRHITNTSKNLEQAMAYHYSHFNTWKRKWEGLMEEVRGWHDLSFTRTGTPIPYKPGWVDHCTTNNLAPDYKFEDVMT